MEYRRQHALVFCKIFYITKTKDACENKMNPFNRFFRIHTDFIAGILLLCTTDSSGISMEVLLWIDVDHSSTGRSAWMVTMAHS